MDIFGKNAIKELDKKIEYQTKLLESLIEILDARKYEHMTTGNEVKKNIKDAIDGIASQVENTPFAAMLRQAAKNMVGGKHGN